MSDEELSRWAAAMAKKRWEGTTQEQRSEHGRMMASKVKRRKRAKKEKAK